MQNSVVFSIFINSFWSFIILDFIFSLNLLFRLRQLEKHKKLFWAPFIFNGSIAAFHFMFYNPYKKDKKFSKALFYFRFINLLFLVWIIALLIWVLFVY